MGVEGGGLVPTLGATSSPSLSGIDPMLRALAPAPLAPLSSRLWGQARRYWSVKVHCAVLYDHRNGLGGSFALPKKG